MTLSQQPWWKGTVYQIYPASFKDSNNDGIGDLNGVIQELDYIKSIGVDIIWLCPMYYSPQVDMGYDISDYQSVYGPYGTVADMEILISEVHRRDMRIILDLVVNHTSNQHAWFKESRSSKCNPKRDWYIWKPAKYVDGERRPPNNWRSNFCGSAWQWDEKTQEYYLHLFCAEQPDLNWDNEETRQAIYAEAMVFWLDKGINGFRVDTVNMYSKHPGFLDAPVTDHSAYLQEASSRYCNGPRLNEYLSEMNAVLAPYEAMSVGECPFTPDRDIVLGYVSSKQKRLNMVFQFDVVDVGQGKIFKYGSEPFNYALKDLKDAISRTQGLIRETDAWTTAFIENHDQSRSISRFGDDSLLWRERSGKMLALMLSALSGTLFIYQGQEIGMINIPPECPITEYKDVDTQNYYRMVAERSDNDPRELAKAKASLQHLSRDHARTPMQWTSSHNGGFTDDSVEPWMLVNPSAAHINVTHQTANEDSVLAFWRRTLQVRKANSDVLVDGIFEVIDVANEKVFSFLKYGPGRKALVMCNFSGSCSDIPIYPGLGQGKRELLIGNVASAQNDAVLQPWEGRLYVLG